MWDDFQIGDVKNSGSATTVPGYNFAENNEEYWFYDFGDLSIGGKVNKNTVVGKKISKMIEKGEKESKILDLVLKNISFDGLSIRELIKEAKEDAFKEGRKSIKEELKELLLID